MNEEDFKKFVEQLARNIYPKGKVKPASILREEELNISGRFNEVDSYHDFVKKNNTALYIAVPAGNADILLERFLEAANNKFLIYTSRCKHYDKDPKDSFRIVFLNSIDPLDGIRREGSFGGDSDLSNEDILLHFEELIKKYPLRFEDISSNTIAGSIQGDVSEAEAKIIATIMFDYNVETANFQSDEEVNEEELDYEKDRLYFIKKLAKQLQEYKTFYYWWD